MTAPIDRMSNGVPHGTLDWGNDGRPLYERVRDYDWDGAIGPSCATLTAMLDAADHRLIAETFWRHYLSLESALHVRPAFTPERLERSIVASADYVRLKYLSPYDLAWRDIAMMRPAPRRFAARTPHRPTAPSPTTTTVLPGPTFADTAAWWPVDITSERVSRLAVRAASGSVTPSTFRSVPSACGTRTASPCG